MYEIPQQLEYKERIAFGLTFRQLAYAFGFFPIIFFIIFKLHVSVYVRFFLALYPTAFAVGFIFFDLEVKLKKWVSWFRLRELKDKLKIEKFFGIKKIDENLIFTKKNKLAVLKIESMNFQIKPKKEQETISLSFQKFLNSLDFPFQILMTTENLELKGYLEGLKPKISDRYKKIFDDYKKHLHEIVDNNNISNRNFYIIIPETTDIGIQVKICEDRLNSLNLRSYRLNNEHLRTLVASAFNNNYDDSYFPKKIINHPYEVEISGKLSRTIYAYGYPRMVELGFLDKIVSSFGDFSLSMHIEPMALEHTMILLNKELQKQRADLYSARLKNQLNPSLEIKYKDTLKTLETLQMGSEKLFNISLYITCKADNKRELDLLTKKIESELNSILIIPKEADFRMIQGFKACLPICEDMVSMRRNMTTNAISAFFPFTSSFFKFDKTGVWLGVNKNKIPIIRDVFKLSNANGICLASSGAGKSYMAKLLISRYLLNGIKVIVIDPQGEYKNLVKKFGGQVINLSRTSDTIINPLDLMGHSYPEKRLALMDLIPIMLGYVTEPQKALMDKVLTEAYERKGIYMDDPSSWSNQPPILEDALKILEKKAIGPEKFTAISLSNRLNLYVNGVFSFLNKHTEIDFNNNFVCLDIGNLPKQVKPTMMFLILDYVYTKMKDSLERKLLVIDEAWSLLSKTNDASYIFEIVKTCRKFNLGLFLINQEVEDMLNSQAGRSVLANSSYTLLLKQKPAVIDDVQRVFNLSGQERIALLTALLGEGILIMEDEHSNIKIVASEEEHKIITTNADEILKNNSKDREIVSKSGNLKSPILNKQNIKINVDENQRLFRLSKLSKNEVDFLLRKRYKEYSVKSIFSNKKERYMIKPRNNESQQHFFLTYDIANYLKKITDKVWLYETVNPDIVFEINNTKYAIEVETGKTLKFNKKQLLEKIKVLNRTYGKNWFFVMTNKKLTTKYNKLAPTCDNRTLKNKIQRIIRNHTKS